MPQFARPASDISTGGWGSTPLWSKLNEVTPDDASFVSSADNPSNDTFECALSAISPPPQYSPPTLTVRLSRTTDAPANPCWTIVTLLEGSRVVTAKLVQPSLSFGNETLTLTQAEADSITDYANLRVRVSTGVAITTDCSHCPVAPAEWEVTLSGFTNGTCTDCASLNATHVMTYNGSCTWKKDLGDRCGDGPGLWYLELTAQLLPTPHYTPYWKLFLAQSAAGGETWVSSSPFQCLSSNRLSWFTGTNKCTYSMIDVVVSPR